MGHNFNCSGVKENQDSNSIFLQLKIAIHQHRVDVFNQGRDGVLHYKGGLYIPKVS